MAMDEGLLSGLAEGVKGFFQGKNDAENRALKKMEVESQARARENQAKRQRVLDEVTLRSKGFLPGADGDSDIYTGGLIKDPDYVDPMAAYRDLQGKALLSQIDDRKIKAQQDKNKFIQEQVLKGYKHVGDDASGNPLFEKSEEQMIKDALDRKKAELLNQKTEADIALTTKKAKASSGGPRQIIPGYTHDGRTVINKSDIPDMQQAVADANTLYSLLGSLKQKVQAADKKALMNPFSNTAADVKNILRDAQLLYKSDAFAKLGVLTGQDLAVLEDVLENPTSLMSVMKDKNAMASRYDEAINRVRSRVAQTLGARGLVPIGGSNPLTAQAPPPQKMPLAEQAAQAAQKKELLEVQRRIKELEAKKAQRK